MSIERIVLDSAIDFDGWRNAARRLLASGIEPMAVEWSTRDDAPGLFGLNAAPTLLGATAGEASDDPSAGASDAPPLPAATKTRADVRVPAAFIDLGRNAILHSDRDRFALLYSLLWRIAEHRDLLKVSVDPEVARAEGMVKSVRHDMHKMTAFVRFREVIDREEQPVYIAWFEPTHHIVEATAPFFARRFANRRWAILTPERSVHWDGHALRFAPGAARADAPDDDKLEDLWRTYYASIFNPARLKVAMMQKEMPQKYWRNLPEAGLIAPLVASARHRTQRMIDEPPTPPPQRRMEVIAALHPVRAPSISLSTLDEARAAASRCRQCPLWEPATQTVFGEGPVFGPASERRGGVMLVGEQAGDQEDLAGRPFVGPAGQLLGRALREAGIDRENLYVTNAVKHFKFISKGKRRIHQRPADAEIDACYPWLALEMKLVQPSLIVALGATAARALTGRALAIEANRGRITAIPDGRSMMITVHPSYLLRIPEQDQPRAYARFVDDLTKMTPFVAGRGVAEAMQPT